MTEIPEHLLKRAQAAREKAAAEAGAATEGEASGDSRIPAHLLERSKAAKAGGSVAVAEKPSGAVVAAPAEGNVGIGTTQPSGVFDIRGGNLIIPENSSKVGIGISNPNYQLDVIGTINTDKLITSNLITSNLTVLGDKTILNTTVYQTEELEIINENNETAIKVQQKTNYDVARFYNQNFKMSPIFILSENILNLYLLSLNISLLI